MSHHPHRIVPPVESMKRKERELFHYTNSRTPTEVTTTRPKPSTPLASATAMKVSEPAFNNRLLAGYMAYEFLTKGTLLGKMYSPSVAEVEPRGVKDPEPYGEVASILKTDGTHIPSVVNPTQLARWIQM